VGEKTATDYARIREEIESLRQTTVGQLEDKYRDVFGAHRPAPTTSGFCWGRGRNADQRTSALKSFVATLQGVVKRGSP